MKKLTVDFHKRIVSGIELEGYTILTPSFRVSRKMAFYRKGTAEKGERFTRDSSIGTEYNSRPFSTVREGYFLLKAGLRKYNTSLYRSKSPERKGRQVFLVGGWRDRFAGTHIHLSVEGMKLARADAVKLAEHLHDHIPLLVAITANSPVWAGKITQHASNRVLKGTKSYFRPITRKGLTSREFDEMLYSRGRRTKPPTLEIRAMDSNIPEFTMAALCVAKAAALGWLRGRKVTNKISYYRYLRGRVDAARHGMRARLNWNGEWIDTTEYLNRFVWAYREELKAMDIPYEIWTTLKLLKKGHNGASLLLKAAEEAYNEHPQTWQQRFARRYAAAIQTLLSGNSIEDFIRGLGIRVPKTGGTSLGRAGLKFF